MRIFVTAIFCIALFGCEKPELTEGKWVLKTLNGQDVSDLKEPITIYFDIQGKKISGFAGCNRYFGSFTSAESSVTFSEIGSTKMFCEETMTAETNYMAALQNAQSFEIQDKSLRLSGSDNVILEFVK